MSDGRLLTDSPAYKLTELFRSGRRGGYYVLADLLGVHRRVTYRWITECGRQQPGQVPAGYNLRVLEAADKAGIPRESVAAYLQSNVCPMCGQTVEPGRHVHQ